MTDKIPADTSKLENSFIGLAAALLRKHHLPELTDEDKAALESIPDDAVSHWLDGEKWDFKTKTWDIDRLWREDEQDL